MDISATRLKSFENGTFKAIPSKYELESICKFYDLPLELMLDKCVDEYAKNKATALRTEDL
jgi:DNA primase large subunit